MDTKKAYAVIKRARKILSSVKSREISQKTHDEYMRLGERVLNDKCLLREAETANTYYKRLSAYNYCVEYSIQYLLAKQDGEQREKNPLWKDTVNRLEKAISEFDMRDVVKSERPESFKPKESKRQHIRGLPRNWVQRYWDNVPKDNKYARVIALLIISGVRPAEIEKGVKVNFNTEKNVLAITIWGAKCRKDGSSGQKERVIAIDCDRLGEKSPEVFLKNLWAKYATGKDEDLYIQAKPKALYNYVTRLSAKIWPKRKKHITPYTFRHFVSATLKKTKFFSEHEVAQIMGHASCRSQFEYGSVQQGGVGTSILAVRAEKEPRPVQKSANSLHSSKQ